MNLKTRINFPIEQEPVDAIMPFYLIVDNYIVWSI